MRIVLLPCLLVTRRDAASLNQPRPPVEDVPEQKKSRGVRPFPLRRQARPASAEIILDFADYAKSSAERFREDRHRRSLPRPVSPRLRPFLAPSAPPAAPRSPPPPTSS